MSFPSDLTKAEERLLDAVKKGEFADFGTGEPEQDDPIEGTHWSANRSLRADVIRALCLNAWDHIKPDPKGICIQGAHIIGTLDLEAVKLDVPLRLCHCHIEEPLIFRHMSAKLLDLQGSYSASGIDARGIRIEHDLLMSEGMVVKGEVNLIDAEIGGSFDGDSSNFKNPDGFALSADDLSVKGSVFLHNDFFAIGSVNLFNADIGGSLECSGGTFNGSEGDALRADGMSVNGSIFLNDGFAARGAVSLIGAEIGRNLVCDDSTFENRDGDALNADDISVNGSILLNDGFVARGSVSLIGAGIGRNLVCEDCIFENRDEDALSADGISVKGSVNLRNGFSAKGGVRLLGSEIGRNLDCEDSTFENPGNDALIADGISVEGFVLLRSGFSAKGTVSLLGAEVGGNLECDGGVFDCPGGDALHAYTMSVKGNVFLRNGFAAKGAVLLLGSEIGRNLDCQGGTFENPEEYALSADGISVKGFVFLGHGFAAKGEVRLLGSEIGRNLECDGGTFESREGHALNADNMSAKGNVFLSTGFAAKGETRFFGAVIGGSIECIDGEFKNPGGMAFLLGEASVTGTFAWTNVSSEGRVDVRHSKVGQLEDDVTSWPEVGQLDLDGFQYETFGPDAPRAAKDRIAWLERQSPFRSQPYEQLIRVLRRLGRESGARKIAIAKQVHFRKTGQLSWIGYLWSLFLGFTVAHGYKPQQALWLVLAIVSLGSFIFWHAEQRDAMVPVMIGQFSAGQALNGETPALAEYPAFNPIVYSLDTFLPIVDLHQERYWLPRKDQSLGWRYWFYMWCHIIIGWVLTTVIVAALSGMIKKD